MCFEPWGPNCYHYITWQLVRSSVSIKNTDCPFSGCISAPASYFISLWLLNTDKNTSVVTLLSSAVVADYDITVGPALPILGAGSAGPPITQSKDMGIRVRLQVCISIQIDASTATILIRKMTISMSLNPRISAGLRLGPRWPRSAVSTHWHDYKSMLKLAVSSPIAQVLY